MRLVPALFSVAVLALLAGFVFAGGGQIVRPVAVAPKAGETEPRAQPKPVAVPPVQRTNELSRLVEPAIVAPPELDPADLQREAARAPLSELSLALPPKPKDPGPTLFRPVAVESAIVESMGRRVAIAGAISIPPDEKCLSNGKAWSCGINARAAFRLWLRGRALACDIPPGAAADLIVSCRMGKQDVGAWLVANGWARAAPDGPYGEMQKAAERAAKGIFGRPPDTSGLANPPPVDTTPLVDQPVLSE